jgi:hypothetical protein
LSHRFLFPKTEQVAKEIEMGLEATIRLAEMDEGRDEKNRVGMQIANPNLVVQAETLKERVYWNPKTPFEEIFENHDLTWLWIREAFSFRCAPSSEGFVVEHSHGDKVFDGVLVASRLPPLLRHDFAFLLGVFSRHYAKFSKGVDAMAMGFWHCLSEK